MFFLNPPEVKTAEVYSAMPQEMRRSGVRSAWADANRGGAATDSFLEGPVFDANGNLYVTDIPYGRIFRIDSSGSWTQIAEYDGEPNGMKFLNSRELIIADYKNGLMVCEIATGEVRPFLERRNSERFKGINDLTFDSKGNLYFTDQGQSGLHDPSGRVYRLRKSGQLDLLLSNVPSPNGVVLSPDERVLFVAVTRGNCVWRVPLMEDGSVSKVGQFFTSFGPSGPDGLAMDERGRLIVANPGLGVAWVLNRRAEPEVVIQSPVGFSGSAVGASLTNIAYGGSGRSSLFCTESVTGSILRFELEIAGAPVRTGEG
ncbi:SMP-30/gluconolactonase/LRE family protein [Denitromonas sp.]|uniref:SMP-30/gluconolactonase/LRE family protein n=1 Tax=Denitromonas sp. TaxID=2734609 RepID=UPI003A8BCF62